METPAGWYPDPSNPDPTRQRLRWWDGARWTDHLHEATGPAPVASGSAPSLTKAPRVGQEGYRGAPHTPAQQYPPSQYPAPGVRAIATPDGQALGNLGLRLLARLVDGLLVTAIAAVAGWPLLERMARVVLERTDELAPGQVLSPFALVGDPAITSASSTFTLVLLAVSAVYTILPLKFYGATPGKALCRLRVRDWHRPGLPGWGQCIARWAGCDLLGQVLGVWYLIDFLWPCWDQRRQALHDKFARTVVVGR